jgi:hypothetical protein
MLLATLRLPRPIADDEAHLDGWHLALSDLPYAVCERAAATILREERFMPEPSTVRELALKEIVQLPDADEAWAMIQRKLKCGLWNHVPHAVVPALDDALEALGGTWTLHKSETPERDRDTFYRLWPQIVRRHQRQAPITEYADKSERGMLLFSDVPVITSRSAPPGYVLVEQYGSSEPLVVKVVEPDADDEGYQRTPPDQKPKPIPASIVKRGESAS